MSKEILSDYDKLRRDCGFVAPGHFYSPIPSLDEVRRDERRIFGYMPRVFPGIDMRETEQLSLLEELSRYYGSMPFIESKIDSLRYYFENPAYCYSDAILLHCLIRHVKPRRIIEIGSGFSSCVTLDTNELFFNNSINTTFIDPNPGQLQALLKPDDRLRITVLEQRLQDVAPELFSALGAGDILFIDSTHVSKVNSDVNRIFFEILPMLASGVYVHFHDVIYPFEYPKEWIYKGMLWNEAYMLRAFLQYNSAFRVVLMNTFMEHFHEEFFLKKMPLCLKNRGASIWIRKE